MGPSSGEGIGSLDYLLHYVMPVLVVCLILTVTIFLVYSGFFSRITVSTMEPPFGPMVLAYQTGTGNYKGSGPLFSNCLLYTSPSPRDS